MFSFMFLTTRFKIMMLKINQFLLQICIDCQIFGVRLFKRRNNVDGQEIIVKKIGKLLKENVMKLNNRNVEVNLQGMFLHLQQYPSPNKLQIYIIIYKVNKPRIYFRTRKQSIKIHVIFAVLHEVASLYKISNTRMQCKKISRIILAMFFYVC